MTINSERYLQLLLYSFLLLLAWMIGLNVFEIDFELIGIIIGVTAIILGLITFFFLLYIVELIEPSDNDVMADKFDELKDFLTLKNIVLAAVAFSLSKVYWFISSHINFQTNKHVGIEIFGGKRKLTQKK